MIGSDSKIDFNTKANRSASMKMTRILHHLNMPFLAQFLYPVTFLMSFLCSTMYHEMLVDIAFSGLLLVFE